MALSLLARAFDFDSDSTGAVPLAAVAVTSLFVGNYFGGILVYRQGMRVSTE